ncbi:hypothetical protein SAMN05216334_10438 [Nitrosomonas ureae]|uniref:Uncharacterized protein n=1 Tax=Nitrosomonas ureae TaxID=44577 RepID=A0A1H5T7I6_9PROT|nr:hypothetical protein SAMN05216334_10438 [Nitrosomonas ureae]
MIRSFSRRKKKQSLNLFIFLLLTFLSLGFQIVSIKDELIPYPAQLENHQPEESIS